MTVRRGKQLRRSNPARPDFDPDHSPFFHMARVLGRYSQLMDSHLKKRGLDMARWRVLNLVRTLPGSPISRLAHTAVMRLPTMAKLVYRMVEEGLLHTANSQTDARVTEVTVSSSGESRLADVQGVVAQIFEWALSQVDESDVVSLIGLMRRMHGNLSV